jgi:hypothetical protein
MKDEKKPKSQTLYRIGFCLVIVVVFLTGPLHTAGQEKPLFTENFRLFNHYEGYNGLFTRGCWPGTGNMSNQAQITQFKDKPRVSTGKLFSEIFLGAAANVACGFAGAFVGYQIAKEDGIPACPLLHGGIVVLFKRGVKGKRREAGKLRSWEAKKKKEKKKRR